MKKLFIRIFNLNKKNKIIFKRVFLSFASEIKTNSILFVINEYQKHYYIFKIIIYKNINKYNQLNSKK